MSLSEAFRKHPLWASASTGYAVLTVLAVMQGDFTLGAVSSLGFAFCAHIIGHN